MKFPWRVRLTILAAFLATVTSLRNVLSGYNGWSLYLEHLLIALLITYVCFSVIATVIAWFNLQNIAKRRLEEKNQL